MISWNKLCGKHLPRSTIEPITCYHCAMDTYGQDFEQSWQSITVDKDGRRRFQGFIGYIPTVRDS